jgi:redox-sensitive bicupin YhaK (pirin superfamily)
VITGQVQVGDEPFPHDKFNTLVFSSQPGQKGVQLTRPAGSTSTEDTHLVLIAGEPLDQRVVQYGPFVLNTAQQVKDAFMDFQLGRNGFEKAPGWESEIGKSMRAGR